jgi:hypothetical protein
MDSKAKNLFGNPVFFVIVLVLVLAAFIISRLAASAQ